MTQELRYVPTDPAGIDVVTRLQLYSTADRTGTPTVDVGPAVLQGDGSWLFTFPDPAPGTYFARVTINYADTTSGEDIDDVITLPATAPAQGSEERALWVTPDQVTTTDANPEQLASACRVATDVLWALSGRRWPGLRSDRLRLSALRADLHLPFPSLLAPWTPGRTRGCPGHSSRIDPQLSPISRVVRLTVGDTDVPAEQIVVEDRSVIRVQRATVAANDPLAVNLWADEEGFYSLSPYGCGCGSGGVELVVEWGTPPPEAGAASAQVLATEIASGLAGGPCRIAGNVTSVNRQGVSVLLDPNAFLKEGRTGVPLVDLWITSVNPNKLSRPPEVWWPEADNPVRLPG